MNCMPKKFPGNRKKADFITTNSSSFFVYFYRKSPGVKIVCGILFLSVLFLSDAWGQKQLVLLKKQKVLLRLVLGDEIVFRTKGSKTTITSYVNNIFDTAVVAHKTVVPFHKIDRLYFKRSSFANVVGTLLVAGGVGYFVIDQFNVMVVHGDKANINDRVATTSAIMVAVGLPMMLIRKKYQRMKPGYRLLAVDEGSPFYLRGLEHMDF